MIDIKNLTNGNIISELWRRGELSYLLHPGQIEYLQFIKQSKYIKNMLHCGRGWGKTWFFLCLSMEYAIKHPNSRIVYATQTRESAKQIIIPTYKMITLDVGESVRPKWKTQGHSIDFSNGSTIVVEGADDDHGNKLRGAFAHMIICDELGFWSHPEYVVNHILLPQAQRVNGRVFMTSTTPESLGHEFYHFSSECKANGSYYKKTVYDNPRLTSQKIKEYAYQCGGEESTMFKREYLCEDVVEETRKAIPEFRESMIINDDEPYPSHFSRFIFADLGFVDHTHIVWCYYDFFRAKFIVDDEVFVCNELTDRIAFLIKEKEKNYKFKCDGMYSDNDPQQLQDLRINHGLFFVAKKQYDRSASVNQLRIMFGNNKILVKKRCANLIRQLMYGLTNKKGDDWERIGGLGHLDGIDALRHGLPMCNINVNPFPVDIEKDNRMNDIMERENRRKTGWDNLSDV